MKEAEIRAKIPEEFMQQHEIVIQKGNFVIHGRRDRHAVYIPLGHIVSIEEHTAAYDVNFTVGSIALFKGEIAHTHMTIFDLSRIRTKMKVPEAFICNKEECGYNQHNSCQRMSIIIIDEKGMCQSR